VHSIINIIINVVSKVILSASVDVVAVDDAGCSDSDKNSL